MKEEVWSPSVLVTTNTESKTISRWLLVLVEEIWQVYAADADASALEHCYFYVTSRHKQTSVEATMSKCDVLREETKIFYSDKMMRVIAKIKLGSSDKKTAELGQPRRLLYMPAVAR